MEFTKKKLISHFTGVIYLIIAALTMFLSCTHSPREELDSKIKLALREDNKIEEKEWNDLISFIVEHKNNFSNLAPNDKVSEDKVVQLILDISNRRRNQSAPDIFRPESKKTTSIKPVVSVFIENSGSMDGYVNGATDFEAALSDLLIQAEYWFGKQNRKINFINSKVYPSQVTEVRDFIKALEPDKGPYKVGDRTTSELNEILKEILDSTDQNTISILVSDCIYSLEKNKSTEGSLQFAKSLTKGAFLEKSKEFDFATIVLKMKSRFTGTYWKKDNSSEQLPGVDRPYYIWIIGSNISVNELASKINTQSLKGFEHSYFLSNFTKEKPPFYTVLKETGKIGSFRQADRHQIDVRAIEDLKYKNGQLQFSIAVDLSAVPVDSSYLTEVRNYKVPDGFTVQSVEKIDRNKLSHRDMLVVEKTTATHFIIVSTTDKFSVQDLTISLSNQVPRWVENSSSVNDLNIQNELDKTFGFAYLVEGVSEAYQTQNPDLRSYFMLTVKMNKAKTGGSPLKKIMISVVIVGLFLFLILVLIRRRNQN